MSYREGGVHRSEKDRNHYAWSGEHSRRVYQCVYRFMQEQRGNNDAEDARYYVAFSGGPDSLALLTAVCQCIHHEKQFSGDVTALIINHQLQEQAVAMTEHALEQAQLLGARTQVIEVTVLPKNGMEADARDARYQALLNASRGGKLLLGHTVDDQIETIFLGLLRGSGPNVLSGMSRNPDLAYMCCDNNSMGERDSSQFKNEPSQVFRPLLDAVRREDTWHACHEWRVRPLFDEHNVSSTVARAKLRNHVLPVISAELGPHLTTNLVKSAQLIRDDNSALEEIATKILTDTITTEGTLPCHEISSQPVALFSRVVRLWLNSHGITPHHVHITHIMELATNPRWTGPVAVPRAESAKISKGETARTVVAKRKHEGKTFLYCTQQ